MEFGVLFGRPQGPQSADDRFEVEADALEMLGVDYAVIPLEPVVNGAAERALERLPEGGGRRWLYRGWMLDEGEYEGLYEAVLERGDVLVTHPSAFAAAHYLPNYVPEIAEHTPRTCWSWGEDPADAWEEAVTALRPPPWIVKDHVKSAKDDWARACYVPPGAGPETFAAICRNLLEARGDRFERGFVVREFAPLAPLPFTADGQPVFDEHRLIFWQGELVAQAPYYDLDRPSPDPETFAFLGRCIDSPFFTADVARTRDGRWIVIELNDGGCSVLPELLDPRDLYAVVLDRMFF